MIKIKKILAIFAFCFLLFAFSSSPARAVTCPDGIDPDPSGNCCNWGDKNTNLDHIEVGDPGCREGDWRCYKDPVDNPGSQPPYGPCLYCHSTDICKWGPGCSQTCNWACCAGQDNGDDEEEEYCHMDFDENLTTCCQLEEMSGLSGTIASIINAIRNLIPDDLLPYIIPTVSLTVNNFKASEDFNKATDYYYGQTKVNESGGEEIEEGVFFRLAPPNLLQEEQLSTEEKKVGKRNEWAQWIIGTSNISGRPGDDAVNDGKLHNVEPYRYAVEDLRNFLVAIPKPGNLSTSQEQSEPVLAANTSLNTESQGKILGAVADACSPPIEADTKETCTPSDATGGPMGLGDLLNLLTGGLNLFPKVADLDKIGRYTAGVETDGGEGTAKDEDPNYADGGFLEIFKLPAEEEYLDRNAKGEAADLNLHISIPNPAPLSPPFTFNIPIGSKLLKLRHQGSDTEAREKENGVYAKLSVPQAEDSTTGFEGTSEPAIYLASNPSVQGTTYYPQTTSFAERLGRTLGGWLAKIITL